MAYGVKSLSVRDDGISKREIRHIIPDGSADHLTRKASSADILIGIDNLHLHPSTLVQRLADDKLHIAKGKFGTCLVGNVNRKANIVIIDNERKN